MLKPSRVIAVATLILSAGSLVACSTSRTLNTDDVQNAISKGLTDQVGGTYEVKCPDTINAEKGGTFTCDVKDPASGQTAVVTVTQTDDQGKFDWKITSASSVAPSAAPASSGS